MKSWRMGSTPEYRKQRKEGERGREEEEGASRIYATVILIYHVPGWTGKEGRAEKALRI